MKTIQSILCLATVFSLVGCNDNLPIDEEQYQKIVYLTRAIDEVKNEYVNYAYDRDTIYVSVSVSGTTSTDRDIRVTFREDDEAIAAYNKRNLSASDIQNRHLPADAYEYPQQDVVIKAGQTTAIYPVYIHPEKLHCDSLYMLPMSIASVSAYEIKTKIDTVLLAKVNLVNKYSGKYYMRGSIINVEADSKQTYDMPRTLVATNRNSIRMFHEAPETKTYLQNSTITISVQDDKSLVFDSWNSFNISGGGGTYLPGKKLFDLWYEYTSGDTKYRVEGYLYEVPETEIEQENIDDWIDEQLRLKEQGEG